MTELTFRTMLVRRPEGSVIGNWWQSVDRWTLGALLALFAVGTVLGLAASPPLAEENGLWTYHYVVRQAVFAVMGLCVIGVLSMMDVAAIRRLGVLLFVGTFVATAALPWFGTDFGKGAVRWYSLGIIGLQPSEFIKPAFAIMAAWLMAGAMERGGPPGRLLSGLLAAGIAAILALQPDFGQAMLVLSLWAAMLFASGAPIVILVGFALAVGAGGAFAYMESEHVARRIDGYLAEGVDPRTQLAYAQSAISEGGFFGVGAAQGQVKWTLPDAHTDFIIAVAAEEFGLILTLGIAALYLFITLRALARLLDERSAFIRLAGTGLAVQFGLQAFINFSVAIRLLPAKGMTLPFISYGGSSMMASALVMGALLAMTRTREPAALRPGQ
ncbi:MAG TPA: putative peptidoglycan glycosyltransferase FtsW [Paracoccaceae bacterium]|nr:putative peptidoglycan glycosyltransferase FtsW [Paracoccaceae bacterium]